MTRRAPLAPHLSGAAFRVGDVPFHGATRGRLRASDLQHPFTAVRSIGLDLDDALGRCLAYEPLLRQGEAFSHETAAALLRLPLPHDSSTVHVLAPPGATRARGRGVVGHAASVAPPVVLHDGLPVVAPAYVWCQLANGSSMYDLVALGDAVVTGLRRGEMRLPALASLDELRDAARGWGSRRGAVTIAEALPRIRVGAESPKETHLRLMLVDAGLPEPMPNPPVRLPSGATVHPDLADRRRRIAFEYLGDIHRTDRRRWQDDLRRRRELTAAGWHVVEVTADDLTWNREAFIAGVRALLGVSAQP
ncbi:hypothetical protein BCL57_003370 [Agromyces flavus]|uniref:DUF559 domain-containing protein n=1 Tax=Agromyces flavus TaxID=589382 RepID=A0A1H1MXS5_9MICO|nr:hypothetical protein [Agromyces flavus]MCP2369187.1 hypothetical protein [Agromyces flavus]GGI48668.1 hypothetical protein GCM10010932_33560 [Agromyces flavus]SDR91470.1 hypothetical protein SAMN04489721_0499 [Agromyces flavus]